MARIPKSRQYSTTSTHHIPIRSRSHATKLKQTRAATRLAVTPPSLPQTALGNVRFLVQSLFDSNGGNIEAIKKVVGRSKSHIYRILRQTKKFNNNGKSYDLTIKSYRYREAPKRNNVKTIIDKFPLNHDPTVLEVVLLAPDTSSTTIYDGIAHSGKSTKKEQTVDYQRDPSKRMQRFEFCLKLLLSMQNRDNTHVFIDETGVEAGVVDRTRRISNKGEPAHGPFNRINKRGHNLNIILACDRDGVVSYHCQWDAVTKSVFHSFFKQLILDAHERCYSEQKIVFVLDNHGIHNGLDQVLTEFYDANPTCNRKMTVMFTSTHSPDLNLTEYINSMLKARIAKFRPLIKELYFTRPKKRGQGDTEQFDFDKYMLYVTIILDVYREGPFYTDFFTEGFFEPQLCHTYSFAQALITTKGDYTEAKKLLSTHPFDTTPIQRLGRVYNWVTKSYTSRRALQQFDKLTKDEKKDIWTDEQFSKLIEQRLQQQ